MGEAKQLEREAKRAEWEARQAARIKTQASRAYKRDSKDDDSSSNATDFSTTASLTEAIVDENEVERLAMMDKDVRKFVKVLREIVKLECRADIDELQKKKIAKKSEVEDQLYAAKYHAKLRARNQLRYKECAYSECGTSQSWDSAEYCDLRPGLVPVCTGLNREIGS